MGFPTWSTELGTFEERTAEYDSMHRISQAKNSITADTNTTNIYCSENENER